ncbi:MAG: hypothetical protein ACI835_004187 [Planctomycetota bacterium]|jgi:hypothetical protein
MAARGLTQDPYNSSKVYAAFGGGSVWASTGGGSSFTMSSKTSALSCNEVSVDVQVPGSVCLAASSNATWKSSDVGSSFVTSSLGIGALNFVSIAHNPVFSTSFAVAFRGLNDGGVYMSQNGGLTWTLQDLPTTRFTTLGFGPNGEAYAICDGPITIAREGLYRRTGGSWLSLGPDQGPVFDSRLTALRFCEVDQDLILLGGEDFGVAGNKAAIWRSQDFGITLSRVYTSVESHEAVRDIEVAQDVADQLMLARFHDLESIQDGGVLGSSDGGTSWTAITNGVPPQLQGESLCASPSDDLTFYLADNGSPLGAGGLELVGLPCSAHAAVSVLGDSDTVLANTQAVDGSPMVFATRTAVAVPAVRCNTL